MLVLFLALNLRIFWSIAVWILQEIYVATHYKLAGTDFMSH